MREEEIEVDDDNKTAPENVPGAVIPTEGEGVHYDEWGHTNIDYRRQNGGRNEGPRMF